MFFSLAAVEVGTHLYWNFAGLTVHGQVLLVTWLVIAIILTIAVLGTIFLQAPAPTLTVDQLMEDKTALIDEEVAVRGEIRDGSINETTMTFVLEGSEFDLLIDYSNAGSISNGLGDNRTVYAEGIFQYSDGMYVVEAETIKTSCPSKYEEEV